LYIPIPIIILVFEPYTHMLLTISKPSRDSRPARGVSDCPYEVLRRIHLSDFHFISAMRAFKEQGQVALVWVIGFHGGRGPNSENPIVIVIAICALR